MAERDNLPYLLISRSTDPDNTQAPIYLSENPTCLGDQSWIRLEQAIST